MKRLIIFIIAVSLHSCGDNPISNSDDSTQILSKARPTSSPMGYTELTSYYVREIQGSGRRGRKYTEWGGVLLNPNSDTERVTLALFINGRMVSRRVKTVYPGTGTFRFFTRVLLKGGIGEVRILRYNISRGGK
jgi:hypothetical protein